MSTTSILSVIQYYQRSIEKCQTDEARLLHCVSKLYSLPVKVEHLQETGIGKTVNSLRKFEGEIGSAAKALVAKWKAMVAAEEEPMETSCNQDETNNSNGNGGDTDDEGQYDQNRNSNKIECDEPSQDQGKERAHGEVHNNKSKEKGHHKHSSSSSHHKSSSLNTHANSSSSSKHKSKSSHSSTPTAGSKSSNEKKKSHSDAHHKSRGKDDEKKEHKSDKLKEKEVDERKKEDKHKSSSSSRHKESSNSHKKEYLNSSEEHHSKKLKSSPDSHKESSHRHSSHNKGHKDNEKTSSSASKEKERKIQKDAERTQEKHKSTSKEREHSHDKKKHTSSSKPTSSSSSNHNTKDPASTPTDHTLPSTSSSSAERKRRRHSSEHDSSNESIALKPKAVKQTKAAVAEENDVDEEDFIDSSMGANFADVLGMLNKPSNKKSKKLSSAIKSPSASVKASTSTHAKSSSSSSKDSQHKSSSSSSSKVNGVRSSTSSSVVATTSRKSDMKPDLLSSSTKLEPLDPSIALELPTISTNYKPMPLNQTVMDCVFASSSTYSNAPKAPVRTLTDAEALNHGISSKTMRTKIYSGVRTGQLLHAPSLFDLCIRVLQKNIDALEYTGGVPFEVLRPVLDRATPQQLLIFEEYNPYLMEDSDTLWQQHVSRHYRAQKRKEMESWREMFLRCQEDQERKLNILAESIKQSQKIIAAPVRKTQLAFVDSMVKPPRNVLRKQEQYGTKSKLIATPASRVASLSSVTPNAAKTGDARLRVAATVRDHAQVSNAMRPKKAPLMAKTLQLMRGRQKR